MDEDFLDVTKGNKKVGFIFILATILLAVLGYFFVFKDYRFSLKTVELELGEELPQDIKHYLSKDVTDIKSYKLDLSRVRESEVGTYTYTVKHNKTIKKGKVKVVDTTPPEFTLKELDIEEESKDYFLGDLLATCEDLSKPCLVSLKNDRDEEKFKEVGTHTIDIVVADLYGNKKKATATVNIIEKGKYVDPRSLDLEYASNSKNIENFDEPIFEKLDKALDPDTEEASDAMSRVSIIDLEEYVRANFEGATLKSSEIIVLYNKSSFVIGYSIELVIFDGKEKTIYVEKDKVPVSTETESDSSEE